MNTTGSAAAHTTPAGIAGSAVAAAGAAGPGLGRLSRFVSAHGNAEGNSGEEPQREHGPDPRGPEARRLIKTRRWVALLDSGDPRAIREAQLAFLHEYLPHGYGTKYCLATLRFNVDYLTGFYNDETEKARWHGAAWCSNVWGCPVCSERITRVKRDELKVLLAQTQYRVAHIIYTLSHHDGEGLHPMVDAQNAAIRAMKKGRAWRRFVEKWGIVGHIHALEVTYGNNGWHPHRHELFVLDPEKIGKGPEAKARLEGEMEEELFQMYHYQLNKAGRDCDREHGVEVKANRKDYGDYITKWGATEELTRSTQKQASGGGRSVWELLSDAIRGDRRSWELFLEYLVAFKGKKQLHWSKGLRDLLELGAEVSDEEAAAEPDPEPVERVVVLLSKIGLQYLIEKDLRYLTLRYIEEVKGDPEAVLAFLARRGIRQFVMGGPGYNGPESP